MMQPYPNITGRCLFLETQITTGHIGGYLQHAWEEWCCAQPLELRACCFVSFFEGTNFNFALLP
jgi:hypothetical protein